MIVVPEIPETSMDLESLYADGWTKLKFILGFPSEHDTSIVARAVLA